MLKCMISDNTTKYQVKCGWYKSHSSKSKIMKDPITLMLCLLPLSRNNMRGNLIRNTDKRTDSLKHVGSGMNANLSITMDHLVTHLTPYIVTLGKRHTQTIDKIRSWIIIEN